jgi:UDP-N-acetylmuramoyl-tripeptide--D-alanyl-D-alanine ligase
MKANWHPDDILTAVRGRSLHAQDWRASGVSIDSRSISQGELFVAIKGPSCDGHNFVRQARDAGSVAAIVDHQPPNVPADYPLIFVEDTFSALHDLGRAGRARSNAKIIAVTGSVGKTSSKEQLRLMLGLIDKTFATQGSYNNHWGVPLSLCCFPYDCKYGIFEIGMNHAGELGPLSDEVHPHVALITNVEAVHLEHFESTEAIARAKAEIFLGLEPSGTAVINTSSLHADILGDAAKKQGVATILTFGLDSKNDAYPLHVSEDDTSTTVEALIMGKKISYRMDTIGQHFVINAMGTLLCCAAIGADVALCAEALYSYRPPLGRGTKNEISLAEGGTFTLIDETFNASPVATKAAIEILGKTRLGTEGRRILALGDMRELGPSARRLHEGLAEVIFENKIDLVHCCGELMSHLHELLPPSMQGKLRPKSDDLAPLIASDLHNGDVLLVKGSHSMHMEKIIEVIKKQNQTPSTSTQEKKAC